MEDKHSQRIEQLLRVSADIGILLVVALIVFVAIRNRQVFFRPGPVKEVAVGEAVSLKGVDWGISRRTFILVLSAHCSHCAEGAEFYRTLGKACERSDGIRLVAALPESVPEARTYLEALGIAVADVYQVDMRKIRVAGTPTILIADSHGILLSRWKGKLDPPKEVEVLKGLAL